MQADCPHSLEIAREVHVPQRGRLVPRQAERPEAAAGLVHDAGRAPGYVREQRRFGRPHADQGVAAVLRRNDDHVGVIAQNLGRRAQVIRCEGRAVAADHQHAGVRPRDGRQHARAKVAIRLARERDGKARTNRLKGGMSLVRRRPQADRTDGGSTRGFDRALDQAALQHCGAAGSQHRDEPRLGETRYRRLGQHRDRDRLIHSRNVAPALSDQRRRNRRAAAATSAPRCGAHRPSPSAGRR